MRSQRVLLPFLFLAASAVAAPAASYRCTDKSGALHEIVLGKTSRKLRTTRNGQIRETALTAANLVRKTSEALYYNGWDRGSRDRLGPLDMGTEFSVRYEVAGGKTVVHLSLVTDHRETPDLKCSAVSQAVNCVSEPVASQQRHLAALEYFASLRDRQGLLTPMGIKGVESQIRRVFNAGPSKFDLAVLAEPIKKIAPDSIGVIAKRLPSDAQAFWKKLLTDSNYAYFSEVARFAIWVVEGARRPPLQDLASIRSGIRGFCALPVFGEKDMRSLFITSLGNSLKQISEAEMYEARRGLAPEAGAFLVDSWMKANGRRTIADYPEIPQHLGAIQASLEKTTDFDPALAQKAIMAFFKTSLARDAQARALFVQEASSVVKRMTPRQREDLLAWVEADEKKTILELLE